MVADTDLMIRCVCWKSWLKATSPTMSRVSRCVCTATSVRKGWPCASQALATCCDLRSTWGKVRLYARDPLAYEQATAEVWGVSSPVGQVLMIHFPSTGLCYAGPATLGWRGVRNEFPPPCSRPMRVSVVPACYL